MQRFFLAAILVLCAGTSYAVDEAELEFVYEDRILPYFQEHISSGEFVGRNGITIRYLAVEAEVGGTAVVLLNGREESFIKYAEFLYDLRDSGLSLYTMDHRGQGFSDRLLDDPSSPIAHPMEWQRRHTFVGRHILYCPVLRRIH